MLATAYQSLYQIIAMVLLMICSALFSGSETAFFNLSRRQVRLLADSPHRVYHLAHRILRHPGMLLNSLLFGNMIVNVLYFAVSSLLTVRMREYGGITGAAAVAFITFILLVLMGEILPKSLAFANSLAFTKLVALPAYIWLKVFTPLQVVFKVLILEPVLRLALGHKRMPETIGAQEFRILIESSSRQGFITADEKKLLREVVDIGLLKVRHVLRPRVDMVACDITDGYDKARQVMCSHHLTKMPVYSGEIDSIVGVVHLREILLHTNVGLNECVHPVHFVPEQKTVTSLLEFFRQRETDVAVVVDEYGGIVGMVELEDIAEELLGPVRQAEKDESIKKIGPFEYRLPGGLAIHDWADAFGIDIGEMRISTLGGLVTELLGHMPAKGDVAHLRNLKFTVDRVQRHRIETLILSFQPGKDNG